MNGPYFFFYHNIQITIKQDSYTKASFGYSELTNSSLNKLNLKLWKKSEETVQSQTGRVVRKSVSANPRLKV